MSTEDTALADPSEIIEPNVAERVVAIGPEGAQLLFNQKPLSFFGKLDFFAVLGKALDTAMAGEGGISLAEMFDELPDDPAQLRAQDLKDQNTFVRGLAKIVAYAPEMLADVYCVILAVPKGRRDLVKQLMAAPESEGGLSDEDGIGILNTFIDQNWEVLVDFFKGPARELAQKIGGKVAEQKKEQEDEVASESSLPSKSSPATPDDPSTS